MDEKPPHVHPENINHPDHPDQPGHECPDPEPVETFNYECNNPGLTEEEILIKVL